MSLLAAYAFNEGAGTTAAEVDGGVAITDIPGWAAGLHGNALLVSGGAIGPDFSPFSVNTNFAIMFDLRVNGPGSTSYTVVLNDWENQGDSAFGNVQITPSGNLDWYLGVGDTGVPIPTGEWKHIALTGDGTWRRAFVDGVQAGQASNTNRSGTGPLVLGGFTGYSPDIRIDNLRIYDEALDVTAIAALAGTPVLPTTPPDQWWEWSGAAKEPITLLGEWDGAATQPLTPRVHE